MRWALGPQLISLTTERQASSLINPVRAGAGLDLCNLVFPSAGFPGPHCVGAEATVTFSRLPALLKPCLPEWELAHQPGGRGAAGPLSLPRCAQDPGEGE